MAPLLPESTDLPTGALFARPFAAVLFDMDGTLIDSLGSVQRSWLRWAAEYEVEPERLLGWHGVPARQIVAALVPQPDVAAAQLRIEAMEIEDVEGIVLLPGAVRAMLAVGGRGAIVTSCTRDLAAARITVTRMPVPRVVVTATDVRHGKPDPEPYLLGAARMGVDPRSCLVVEDAASGVASGRAAGCRTLGVLSGQTEDELDADVVVPSLADVRFETRPDGVWVLPAEADPRG